ncbi:MAG TPA: BldC family transcriptional regulator [Streptosporangiaceae bacterium]|nr:BldC family transcriptional regulator [Streptosporangiaceae bacterium]
MAKKPAKTAELMTVGEVAAAFRVDVRTVGRWARSGKLAALKTPGGHRRYFRAEVETFLHGGRRHDRHANRQPQRQW